MVERVRVPPDVAWVEVEGRVVVIRLAEPATDPLVLADSAAEVWFAVGNGASVDGVVAAVAAAYDVAVVVVEADVRALVDQALDSGILISE